MGLRNRFAILALALLLWWSLPACARAQGMGGMTMPTNMGSLAGPTGQLAGAGKPGAASPDAALSINDSYVSFIDGALPHNVLGTRFEATYINRQPLRATYLFPKGGVAGAVGFPLPEPRVDTLELSTYAEYSLTPWLSLFMEGGYRWINPDVNANQSGPGDMRYGLKVCTWSDENIIATVLLRIYQPSARYETLGTGHWSVEPGLLAAYRVNDKLHLEGEFRYWIPLGGSDFSGDILRYGLGLSYGKRNPAGIWYMPVVEGIGWTVLGGKTMLASSPDNFEVQDARNTTIVNAYLGLRAGYGKSVDLYLGYGRSLTGQFWSRETYRFEVRFLY